MFILIDCNNFFVSCERIFRPDLATRPVAVLSNNDGCVIARSNEVKTAGVPMGAAHFKYRDVLEQIGATIFSSNFELYADISHRVIDTLKTFTPDIEPYSVDEAFLEMGSIADPEGFGNTVRYTIARDIGIPVSVGIAPTKTLAKLATSFAKKSGTGCWHFPVPPGKTVLSHIPVDDLWGIGKKSAQRLAKKGIETAWDLKAKSPTLVHKILNINAVKTQQELHGVACLELEDSLTEKKGILSSRSFGTKSADLDILKGALAKNIHTASKKLRKQKSEAHLMHIFIRTSPHIDRPYTASAYTSFPEATDNPFTMIDAAAQLLETIYLPQHRYAKTGVYLSQFTPKHSAQTSYLGQNTDATDTLTICMDKINQKFKDMTLIPATIALGQSTYRMSQNQRSPRYTTRWKELPLAH